MPIRILNVPRLQRVAVLSRGRLVRLLEPGTRIVWVLGRELVPYDVSVPVTPVVLTDPLPVDLPGQRIIEVREGQRAIVSLGGVQSKVLGPGRYRTWDALPGVTIEVIDVRGRPAPLAAADLITVGGGLWSEQTVGAKQAVVLYQNDVPIEALPVGRYRVWNGEGWRLKSVGLELRSLAVAAQDLVTADQIPVRVKPVAAVRVVDPLVYVEEERSAEVRAYEAIQLALREVVAGRTLETLLAERETLGREVLELARGYLPEVGLAVAVASIKDVILPGEVRDILSKVTVARKESEAQAIRRREEVATTRQLANTAKLLDKNPVLTRLKELEALGELLGKVDKVTLVGSDLLSDVLSAEARQA